MTVPTSNVINVSTYQKAEIAELLNSFVMINRSNKRFMNFQQFEGNLGDTVNFYRQPKFQTVVGLAGTGQASTQKFQTLTCGSALNISMPYSDEQFLFNVQDYMDIFGRAAIVRLGTDIETQILLNFTSSMINLNPNSTNPGAVNYKSGPFRFFGDGTSNAINSYQQLAQAVANFRDFGCAMDRIEGIIPLANEPTIIGSGLSQFALARNNKDAESWEVGRFAGCDWYSSNLLPQHTAGTIGDAAAPNNVMTVVSTSDPTGQNVTQITFTEPTGGTSATAIRAGDLLVFKDGVSGKPNMRALVYNGSTASQQPVQFRAIADAASVAGSVTVSLQTTNDIGLVWGNSAEKNINNEISAGMKVTVMPSHRAGAIHSGNQFYLAMPKLPSTSPYESSIEQDPDSGASIRHYWGTLIGQAARTYFRDVLFGATMVSENCMRLLFPL